jgi:hypothetical protein
MEIQCLFKKLFGFKLNNPPPFFLICTLLTAHFMDINFNGTIITLFGSLPLETLGLQGGAGLGPSSLDVFCSRKSSVFGHAFSFSRQKRQGMVESEGWE